jgi:hypothetical protein
MFQENALAKNARIPAWEAAGGVIGGAAIIGEAPAGRQTSTPPRADVRCWKSPAARAKLIALSQENPCLLRPR